MATVFCFAFWVSLLSTLVIVSANPEQGKWTFQLTQNKQFAAVAKHMFSGSKITVTVSLSCGDDITSEVEISWLLRFSPCSMEFAPITESFNNNKDESLLQLYMNTPLTSRNMSYNRVELLRNNLTHPCSEEQFNLEGTPGLKIQTWIVPKIPEHITETNAAAAAPPSPGSGGTAETAGQPGSAAADQRPQPGPSPTLAPPRQKRAAAVQVGAPDADAGSSSTTMLSSSTATEPTTTFSSGLILPADKVHHQPLAKAWVDGNFLFVIHFKPKAAMAHFNAEVTIRMFYGDDNYISALDYPLLIFYGVMGLIYMVFGVVWLLMLACNWRDLLRVQFWIGGVILLGMLEKAVFFGEYEHLNNTGESVKATIIFAELVSCLKRTLARMLVIIVSLGFGIVRPRLGQAFHKVLLVGGLFFCFSAVEGCLRATSSSVIQSNYFLLASVPLAVLDAVICWWIFSNIIQTTRTLRLRRNVVKLSLYRHFTNALIFNVLSSVAYMVWALTEHRFQQCLKDWQQLWVDEAFWHVLFVVLLFIIIILWRPTANNQRFAFSPLLDAAEEEEEQALNNDAFEGMKMRGSKNGSPKQRDSKKMEEDLKWVEENIPSSVADKALPSMLDSDEELMTTKFEMSKME
ncbi:transmembrane protein 87A-like [Babylonia areolata]|uniref:transmembrane protein 87A-like n=1 Tax=Babylonia areolata TaxID=304850 RepID=UPI003FD466FC